MIHVKRFFYTVTFPVPVLSLDDIDQYYVPDGRFERLRFRWFPVWAQHIWPIRLRKVLGAPQHFNCRCSLGEITDESN